METRKARITQRKARIKELKELCMEHEKLNQENESEINHLKASLIQKADELKESQLNNQQQQETYHHQIAELKLKSERDLKDLNNNVIKAEIELKELQEKHKKNEAALNEIKLKLVKTEKGNERLSSRLREVTERNTQLEDRILIAEKKATQHARWNNRLHVGIFWVGALLTGAAVALGVLGAAPWIAINLLVIGSVVAGCEALHGLYRFYKTCCAPRVTRPTLDANVHYESLDKQNWRSSNVALQARLPKVKFNFDEPQQSVVDAKPSRDTTLASVPQGFHYHELRPSVKPQPATSNDRIIPYLRT